MLFFALSSQGVLVSSGPTEVLLLSRERLAPAAARAVSSRVEKKLENPIARAALTTTTSHTKSETQETASSQGAADASLAFESYEAEVIRLLNARKAYPEMARRLRQQGRVTLRFTLHRDGRVLSYEIVKPSTFHALNEAALKIVRESPQFSPFPNEVQAANWVMTVPIEFKM